MVDQAPKGSDEKAITENIENQNCIINWGAGRTIDLVAFGFIFLHCFFENIYPMEQYCCRINIKHYQLSF